MSLDIKEVGLIICLGINITNSETRIGNEVDITHCYVDQHVALLSGTKWEVLEISKLVLMHTFVS